MLRFACPACGIGIQVPPERAGSTVRCGKCGRSLRIPVAAPVIDQAIRNALPIAPPATLPGPASGKPSHASHPHEARGGTRATAPLRTQAIQVDARPDRLEPHWYWIIWGAILVPVVGSWVIVILSSALYYAWRDRYPVRARIINLHGWLAFGAGHLLACLVFLVYRGTGDSLVDLRGLPLPVGTILRTETNLKGQDGSLTITGDGKEVHGKSNRSTASVEEVKILDVRDGRPTKFSKTVIAFRTVLEDTIDGMVHPDTDVCPLENETILFEVNGGDWVNSLAGKQPTPRQARRLAEMLPPDSDDFKYPLEPVRPGHTWSIKGAALHRFLGPGFLLVEGEISCIFERIETFQGEPCAVISCSLQVKGKMLNDDGQEFLVEMGGIGKVHRSLGRGVDLQETMRGQWQFQGIQTDDGVPVRVRIRGQFVFEVRTWLR